MAIDRPLIPPIPADDAGQRTGQDHEALTGIAAGQGLVVAVSNERARRDSNPQPSDP